MFVNITWRRQIIFTDNASLQVLQGYTVSQMPTWQRGHSVHIYGSSDSPALKTLNPGLSGPSRKAGGVSVTAGHDNPGDRSKRFDALSPAQLRAVVQCGQSPPPQQQQKQQEILDRGHAAWLRVGGLQWQQIVWRLGLGGYSEHYSATVSVCGRGMGTIIGCWGAWFQSSGLRSPLLLEQRIDRCCLNNWQSGVLLVADVCTIACSAVRLSR